MSFADDITHLSLVSLFDGFSEEQLRLLSFGSRRRILRAGETLFREGALSDGGYVVMSGQIDLLIEREGREIIMASQLESSLIGETALIAENRRPTTALARTDCEVIHIQREQFRRMLNEYPQLAVALHQRMSDSVKTLMEKMRSVETRLANSRNLSG